ncbi:hypothetical protein BTIS_1138 [Bifidobacterium tissieri]|uniref:Uncharacterized protein n=1 Tax=Bifidobacterium tissieri TaxID=1630162 RepID=A0A261FFI9_9BIFI|nr:hypothetical protein [Bifidobacterium tissieri]OZG57897.1 hypothetical protein BTIS_1138 [Bifidobacterium tissieri]
MFNGIPLAMRVEYAVVLVPMLVLLIPVAASMIVRSRLEGSLLRVRSRGMVAVGAASCASMLGLVAAALILGMPDIAVMPTTSNMAMCYGAAVAFCALMVVALPAFAAAVPATVGALLHRLAGLPAVLHCDRHVADSSRSWSRQQWVPRWARFSLPDVRI